MWDFKLVTQVQSSGTFDFGRQQNTIYQYMTVQSRDQTYGIMKHRSMKEKWVGATEA